MGEVVGPQNVYTEMTWPDGPLGGFRGSGAQNSLRTSTLRTLGKGMVSGRITHFCSLENFAPSSIVSKGGALHAELANKSHSVRLVHYIPQSHREPYKGGNPRPYPQKCCSFIPCLSLHPPPQALHEILSRLCEKCYLPIYHLQMRDVLLFMFLYCPRYMPIIALFRM